MFRDKNKEMVDKSITGIALSSLSWLSWVFPISTISVWHHSNAKINKESDRKIESFKNLIFRRQRLRIMYEIVSMHWYVLMWLGWVTLHHSLWHPANKHTSLWTDLNLYVVPRLLRVEPQTSKCPPFNIHGNSTTPDFETLLKSVFLDKHFLIGIHCWVCLLKHF